MNPPIPIDLFFLRTIRYVTFAKLSPSLVVHINCAHFENNNTKLIIYLATTKVYTVDKSLHPRFGTAMPATVSCLKTAYSTHSVGRNVLSPYCTIGYMYL